MAASPVAGRKRKLENSVCDDPEEQQFAISPTSAGVSIEQPEGSSQGTPKKKKPQKPKKPLDSRFGGKTEEELMQLFLPDHLKPDLDIVFIGINPGLLSAHLGHHYCNANNHFWPCMYESGLVPRKMTYKDDAECLNYGIGFTNIVPRTTRSSNDLTRKEIKEWSDIMINRMKELRPLILCFNGKGIYEIFIGKKCEVGLQPLPLPDTKTAVYVMPSTSGRAASHPRRVDKLKFFNELKELRDNIKTRQKKLGTGDSASSSSPPSQPPDVSSQPILAVASPVTQTTVLTPPSTGTVLVPSSTLPMSGLIPVPLVTGTGAGIMGIDPKTNTTVLAPGSVPSYSQMTPVIVSPHQYSSVPKNQ